MDLPYPTLVPFPDLYNVEILDLGARPAVQAMIRNGSAIDIPYLHELTSQFRSRQAEIAKDIRDLIGREALEQFTATTGDWEDIEFNPQAPDQVSKLLYEALRLGRSREIKRTPSGKLSTGKKELEAIRKEHEVVGKILSYREFGKLVNTYTAKLPGLAKWHEKGECGVCGRRHHERHPRVHTEFLLTRTDTSRMASKAPNLQNIPVRTEWGRQVRAAFMSAPGTKLVNADYSQEELRLLAHFANEVKMLAVFARDGDIHTATAAWAFGVPEDDVDPLTQRLPSKNLGFMLIYGASARGLQAQLALSGLYWSKAECESFIQLYFSTYLGIKGFMEEQAYLARRYGMVWDGFGRPLVIPEVKSAMDSIVEQGIRRAGNYRIQATGGGVMRLALRGVEEVGDESSAPTLTVHDELTLEAEEDQADDTKDLLEAVMLEAWDRCGFRTGMKVEGKVMERWVK